MKKRNPDRKSFWDQPAIKRALPGKTYTRYVRTMRLLLPLAAAGLVGLLIAWPRLEGALEPVPAQTAAPQSVKKNELTSPRYESQDSKGQPFTITAARAIQSEQDINVVVLEKPAADIFLNGGAWVAAQADQGFYRQQEEKLLLRGNVRLFHDKGYEVKTGKLLVHIKSREAWSDQPVAGHGPAGTLEATGLTFQGGEEGANEEKLIFTGPVRLVLNKAVKGL